MSKTALLIIAVFCLTSTLAINAPVFKQGDPRWKGQTLGFGPSTIGSAGCLMTSVTSMVNGAGVKVNGALPNPSTMNAWLKSHGGFQRDLFVWGSISSLGFKFQGKISGKTSIVNAVKGKGKYVILNVNKGGHYVLATGGVTSTGYNVMDPGYNKSHYTFAEVVSASVYTR